MTEETKEKSNYEKILEYFDSNEFYTKSEIIKGLIGLGIAPKGNGLLNRLRQGIFFRKSYVKKIEEYDEEQIAIQFEKDRRNGVVYRLNSKKEPLNL